MYELKQPGQIAMYAGLIAGKLQAAVKWSVTSFFTGIALGTALSMLYLAPQINKFINPKTPFQVINTNGKENQGGKEGRSHTVLD